jgi:hypothetical protein
MVEEAQKVVVGAMKVPLAYLHGKAPKPVIPATITLQNAAQALIDLLGFVDDGAINLSTVKMTFNMRLPQGAPQVTVTELADRNGLLQSYANALGSWFYEQEKNKPFQGKPLSTLPPPGFIDAPYNTTAHKLTAKWSVEEFDDELANYSDLKSAIPPEFLPIPNPCKEVFFDDSSKPVEGIDLSDESLANLLKEQFGYEKSSLIDEEQGTEIVEVTLSGLTPEEAEKVLKTYAKKSSSKVMASTRKMKDIGTGSKAIIRWEFESSSMVSNGTPVKYITQLNEDGTLSCQCSGWTRGSAKNPSGRFCKHTRAIDEQFNVKELHKKWKKGEPLGDDFVAADEQTESITLSDAPKQIVFKSTRIVEV